MNHIEKNSRDNHTRYILLFLFILLTGLGIWKCPNRTENEATTKLLQEKEDSITLEKTVKSDVRSEEKNTPPAADKSKLHNKKDKSISIKPKEVKEPPTTETEQEGFPKIESEREEIIPNEASPKKEIEVHRVNKNIDNRLPATSDVICKVTTTFKIAKSSYQTSVAFSPDGSNFVVGNNNNYASVFNMDGKELFKLIGHKGYVQSVAYSPDGKFIITGSVDKTAKVWDANNGKEIKRLKGHAESVHSVAFSPNGKYISTGSFDHTTMLWDAKSGNKLLQLRGHDSEITDVAFSRNNRYILTGSSDKTAKVWEVSSGEVVYSLEGHNSVVSGVAFTPNDKLIATASADKKLRIWNAQTGKHLHTISGHTPIMSMSISADGKYLITTGQDGSIKL